MIRTVHSSHRLTSFLGISIKTRKGPVGNRSKNSNRKNTRVVIEVTKSYRMWSPMKSKGFVSTLQTKRPGWSV